MNVRACSHRRPSRSCGVRFVATLLTVGMGLCTASVSMAISPSRWNHTTEADFEPGEAEGVIVTNFGDIKLARNVDVIGDMPEEVGVISDLQVVEDVWYIAAGPEAKLLRRNGDELETVLELKDEQVFALDVYDGKLLVAISSGKESRLATLEGDELVTLATVDARYIWDVLVDGSAVICATGADGKLIRIQPMPGEGETARKLLLDATQANLLCLGRDQRGNVYVGTDTDGLIYRVPLGDDAGEPFVIYDADEPEIGAMLVLPDGTVFAGAADANQARPGRMNQPAAAESGRPAAGTPPTGDGDDGAGDGDGEGDGEGDGDGDGGIGDGDEDGDGGGDGDADIAPSPPQTPPAPSPLDPGAGDTPTADGDAAAAGDGDAATSAAPTPEQMSQLREAVRERLQSARMTGVTPMQSTSGRPAGRSTAATPQASGSASKPAGAQGGNAIYRVSPDGFVDEIFRESVMVLRMILDGSRLIVATGNEGQLFQIDLAEEESILLAKLEAKQAPAMTKLPDGRILIGSANPAQLVEMSTAPAESGVFTSKVLDASQNSLWGALNLVASIPDQASVEVQTRTGNVGDPEKAAWSEWSEPVALTSIEDLSRFAPRPTRITSPTARFLQYRLTLKSGPAAEGKDAAVAAGPVVDAVSIAYITPNLRPVVQSVTSTFAAAGGGRPNPNATRPEPQQLLNIEWKAADANGDTLSFDLHFKMADTDVWVPLTEELDQPKFAWDTRTAPDGRYLVRVTATDAPSNTRADARRATRQSDPILVDNTAPEITEFELSTQPREVGDGVVAKLVIAVQDTLSTIQGIDYAVDSQDQWEPVMPSDQILDSTSEDGIATIADLSPGAHVVTVRVTDEQGNTSYKAQVVHVK